MRFFLIVYLIVYLIKSDQLCNYLEVADSCAAGVAVCTAVCMRFQRFSLFFQKKKTELLMYDAEPI